MKIIVNNEESYELSLPEQLPLEQIDVVITRLTKLKKLFSSEMQFSESSTPRNNRVSWSREKAIEIMKVHYSGLPLHERKAKICEIAGTNDYAHVTSKIWTLRKKYDIVPREIGLKEFRTYK